MSATFSANAMTSLEARSRSRVAVVLEEDEHTSRFLSSMLASNGFTVLIAPDGETAVRLCREHSPVDVLVTNLIVHGHNALDLIRPVKDQSPTLKVVAVTEYAAGEIRRAGDTHDVIPVLRKPLDERAIASAIGPPLWSLPRQDHTPRRSRIHLRLVK
jgi:CheY-like chemotaxis protein